MAKRHVLDIYEHTPRSCIGCVEEAGSEAEADPLHDAAAASLATAITYAGARAGASLGSAPARLPWAALNVELALGVRREEDGKVVDYRIHVTLLHRRGARARVALRDARTDRVLEEFDVDLVEGSRRGCAERSPTVA